SGSGSTPAVTPTRTRSGAPPPTASTSPFPPLSPPPWRLARLPPATPCSAVAGGTDRAARVGDLPIAPIAPERGRYMISAMNQPMPLWPAGKVPGAIGMDDADVPTLTRYDPA